LTALLVLPRPTVADEAPPAVSTAELASQIEESPLGPNCGENLPRLAELVARPDFPESMHARRQALHLTHLALCTADSGKLEAALEYANRAAAADPESFSAQGIRLPLGIQVNQPGYSVDAFEAISRLRPEFIRSIDTYRINQLVDAANRSDPSGDDALRVYESMMRAAWQPATPFFDDSIRVGHARLLIARGRIEDARALLAPVADVTSLVSMRVDRRFDALRQDPGFEAQLDLAAGSDRCIARAQGAMEANPRMMQAANQYAAALVAANRHADAHEILSTSLQRYSEDPDAFDDGEANANWTFLQAGRALYAMGRYDDGRRLFEEYLRVSEGDPFVASMRMSLADFLVGEGRAAEALQHLSFAGKVSPYGQAGSEAIRICASRQLNDSTTVMESLSYLRSREQDNESALPHALLCLNDLDGLAELMIRRLNDPASRRLALLSLQVGPATAFEALPFMKTIGDRENALRAREDVRRAVDAVGRIETIPVIVTRLY
jgi:tetratricopeptide (TPR) repeat protein